MAATGIITLLDCRFCWSNRIARQLSTRLKDEDVFFSILFSMTLVFLLLEPIYGQVSMFYAFVDYMQWEDQFLRYSVVKIVGLIILSGFVIAPFIAAIQARRLRRSWLKWFIYTFFISWLAVLWLLKKTVKWNLQPNPALKRPRLAARTPISVSAIGGIF